MTVQQLVEKLKEFHPEAEVVIQDETYFCHSMDTVTTMEGVVAFQIETGGNYPD